jgi:hypothetical protein
MIEHEREPQRDHAMSLEHNPSLKRDAGLDDGDLIWGAEAIGALIGRSREQVYRLLKIGALDGAVRKVGHRTIVGSRRRLHELVSLDSSV